MIYQMELLPNYLDTLKIFEGFRADAYLPKGEPASEYLTIGYGTRLPRTKALYLSPIDREYAEELLSNHVNQIATFVRRSLASVKYHLSDAQFTALVDFCYNCGVGAYKRSTLYKLIKVVVFTADDLLSRPREEYERANVDAISLEFLRWNKSGGKVLEGLTKRCQWRSSLWRSRAVNALVG